MALGSGMVSGRSGIDGRDRPTGDPMKPQQESNTGRGWSVIWRFIWSFGLCCTVLLPKTLLAEQYNCSDESFRCVGPGQEYASIQGAANAAQPGDTVLVFDGEYTGFQVMTSGTQTNPILFKANGSNVVINIPGSSGDGVFLSRISHVTIEGFRIQNMTVRCISARNATPTSPMIGLTLRNNICTNAGHEGFYLSEVSKSLIEENTITGSGSDGTSKGHGIYLANAGSDDTTIRGNWISNAKTPESAGIHLNGDISVGGDGIISGVSIENNMIFNNSHHNGLNMDGVQDCTIQNNTIYGNGRSAIRAYAIDGAEGPKNLRILNNTLIVPSSASGWSIKLTQDGGGHLVFNNILLTDGAGGGSLCVDNIDITSDNNAVADRFSRDGDSLTVSLASWRSQGNDTASFLATATSRFVNVLENDYHLKIGSPAIDAGVGSLSGFPAPGTDLSGVPRPQGSFPDIGAYESGVETVFPTPPKNLRIQ